MTTNDGPFWCTSGRSAAANERVSCRSVLSRSVLAQGRWVSNPTARLRPTGDCNYSVMSLHALFASYVDKRDIILISINTLFCANDFLCKKSDWKPLAMQFPNFLPVVGGAFGLRANARRKLFERTPFRIAVYWICCAGMGMLSCQS